MHNKHSKRKKDQEPMEEAEPKELLILHKIIGY
jgi:hypothetical protein